MSECECQCTGGTGSRELIVDCQTRGFIEIQNVITAKYSWGWRCGRFGTCACHDPYCQTDDNVHNTERLTYWRNECDGRPRCTGQVRDWLTPQCTGFPGENTDYESVYYQCSKHTTAAPYHTTQTTPSETTSAAAVTTQKPELTSSCQSCQSTTVAGSINAGAIVGVCLGVSFLVLAVTIITIFCIRKQRNSQKQSSPAQNDTEENNPYEEIDDATFHQWHNTNNVRNEHINTTFIQPQTQIPDILSHEYEPVEFNNINRAHAPQVVNINSNVVAMSSQTARSRPGSAYATLVRENMRVSDISSAYSDLHMQQCNIDSTTISADSTKSAFQKQRTSAAEPL